MAVSYKRFLHLMIETDISSAQFMHDTSKFGNIMMKIKKIIYST